LSIKERLIVCLTICVLLIGIFSHVLAWEYGNPAIPSDDKYETFGPAADNLLIKLYTSETAEWDAFEGGELDVTDCSLDPEHYTRYSDLPWNETKRVLSYPEFDLYLFDLNNNNNPNLGNPEDPAYPNPVYPNPMSVVELRKAVAYLSDRSYVINEIIGEGFAYPVYTPMSPASGFYVHPEIKPGGALEELCYLYDPNEAVGVLDNSSKFPICLDGWRYWDMNLNGVKDAGEDMTLKLFARSDSPPRLRIAEKLYDDLENDTHIHVDFVTGNMAAARLQVMQNKDFHIYTAGWSLGMDPDHLILWHWDYYWHPGMPPNYAGCNNPEFNAAADGVQYANTIEEATYYAHLAQEIYATDVLSVPLYSMGGNRAVSRTYVGSEPEYYGRYWENFVNIPAYGVDNYFTFLNMHPAGVGKGGVIRYGMATSAISSLNPLYASSYWDNKILDLLGYESLIMRDPYTRAFMPWLCTTYRVGSYDEGMGPLTNITFTLGRNAYWSDGIPVTIDDVEYTFTQLRTDLNSRGLPPPYWSGNLDSIVEFIKHSDTEFEVRLDVKNLYALGWIGGNRILPKHIWQPICTGAIAPKSGVAWDPTTFAPDPDMIHSGPWCLDDYATGSQILLKAHRPGVYNTHMTTDPNKNSEDITSPYGFAFGKVVKFPEDYGTLQGAVDAAGSGDTILVAPGVYHDQSIVVNKTVTIIGLKGSDPVFDGGGSGQIFMSLLPGASGSVIAGLVITNYGQGIVVNASNCRIYSTMVSLMSQNGIALMGTGTVNNQIYGNIFQSNQVAVNLTAYSAGNVVHDNVVSTNFNVGIDLESGGNIVCTNMICGNHLGIRVTSSGNTIFHNNVISNAVQTGILGSPVNAWDDGYPSGGNYWSDYAGGDANGDGIGDTPYAVDVNNVDRYPLMQPFSPHDVGVTNVIASKTVVGQGFCLRIEAGILNHGICDETLTVEALVNTTAIATQTATLIKRNCTTITFAWNTTGFAKGNYTISAVATLPSDTNPADNTFVDGKILVTITGDINGDQYANAKDAVILGVAFGSKRGEVRYTPNADINGDDYCNAKDAVLLGTYFGQHWS